MTAEVQYFVNCDHAAKKQYLRAEFHLLFDKIIKDKLYLSCNARSLRRLQQIHQTQSESSLQSFSSLSTKPVLTLMAAVEQVDSLERPLSQIEQHYLDVTDSAAKVVLNLKQLEHKRHLYESEESSLIQPLPQ